MTAPVDTRGWDLRGLRAPSRATLAKYGLSFEDWFRLAERQRFVCAICLRLPNSGTLHIDHVHVPGWRQLDPDERRLFVRGLVCFHDNRNVINRYATLEKLRRAADYLAAPLPFTVIDLDGPQAHALPPGATQRERTGCQASAAPGRALRASRGL